MFVFSNFHNRSVCWACILQTIMQPKCIYLFWHFCGQPLMWDCGNVDNCTIPSFNVKETILSSLVIKVKKSIKYKQVKHFYISANYQTPLKHLEIRVLITLYTQVMEAIALVPLSVLEISILFCYSLTCNCLGAQDALFKWPWNGHPSKCVLWALLLAKKRSLAPGAWGGTHLLFPLAPKVTNKS